MLVPFIPEEVVTHWGWIGDAISKALPPGVGFSPYIMSNILRAVLAEEAVVWGWQDTPDSDYTAIIVTTEVLDKLSGTKNFLIYCVTAFQPLPPSVWEEGISTFKKIAKDTRCRHIAAYTSIPQLTHFLEERGWSTDSTFITLEV